VEILKGKSMESVKSNKGRYECQIARSGRDLESGWCSAGVWEVLELMHRQATSATVQRGCFS